jgi:hypothetical protein
MMYVRRLFAKLTNFIRHGHAEALRQILSRFKGVLVDPDRSLLIENKRNAIPPDPEEFGFIRHNRHFRNL